MRAVVQWSQSWRCWWRVTLTSVEQAIRHRRTMSVRICMPIY